MTLVEVRRHEIKIITSSEWECNLPRNYMTLLPDRPHRLSRKIENRGLIYGKLVMNTRSQASSSALHTQTFCTQKNKNKTNYMRWDITYRLRIANINYSIAIFLQRKELIKQATVSHSSMRNKRTGRKKKYTCSKPRTRFAHSMSLVISKLDRASSVAILA